MTMIRMLNKNISGNISKITDRQERNRECWNKGAKWTDSMEA